MILLRLVFIITLCFVFCYCYSSHQYNEKMPSVGITVLARNKERSLPYFLSCLRNQNYPKGRIYIWFMSDHNEDKTFEIIKAFVNRERMLYADVIVTETDDEKLHSDETVSTNWTPNRYRHVVTLREEALKFARKRNTDYHFAMSIRHNVWPSIKQQESVMLDADVFLTDESTIRILVNKNKTIVAPLLVTDGVYSNFWCGMNENHYYKWTEDYHKIRTKIKVGCFIVPMVHSAVLVKMKRIYSDYLVYDKNNLYEYEGPDDDIITFAMSAANYGVDMYICNDYQYGYIQIPLEDGVDPKYEEDQFLNTKLTALGDGVNIPLVEYLQKFVKYPPPSTIGMDKIYMINLDRRFKRRELMLQSFKDLGLEVQIVSAVDGQQLDMRNLPGAIKLLPGYQDPVSYRPMKTGEIGCFLSHYKIWQDIVVNGYEQTLILEDDVNFNSYFKRNFIRLQLEMDELQNWDLMYIGRKILNAKMEVSVSDHIVRPWYSYWTIGYILSLDGAKKLLAAEPLSKVLPVDEFLPIMFDQHPNDTWKSFFPVRELNAYSADPLLIEPTHYFGQEGYISDTEDSAVLDAAPPDFQYRRNEL